MKTTQFFAGDRNGEAKRAYDRLCSTYTKERFVFDAKSFQASIPEIVILRQVFRQKDDRFVKMLEEVRRQTMSNETINTFKSLSRELVFNDSIVPTNLYPMKKDANKTNTDKLDQLPGKAHHYHSRDFSLVYPFHELPEGGAKERVKQSAKEHLDKHVIAVENLDLKIGAQVMLIKVSLVLKRVHKVREGCFLSMQWCN